MNRSNIALVVAEHDNASLRSGTFNAVTAAARCADVVHVLVAGHDCARAAQQAAGIRGVACVLVADTIAFKDGLAEPIAEQVLAVASDYSHILAAATAWGKNLLPRVAARLDVGQLSEVTRVLSADTFERPIYAGNAIATVRSNGRVKVITVRTTGFDAAAEGGHAVTTALAPVESAHTSRFVSREVVASARPELAAASSVVSGGRGMGSAANFKLLEPLADRLGAAIGASRAAVDAGYAPNDWQVGQTGKIVAPQLYVAVGISGAIQHLAGMKDSRTIVAINKDPEAAIFSVADYGLVGDLFDIVPELVQQLGLAESTS